MARRSIGSSARWARLVAAVVTTLGITSAAGAAAVAQGIAGPAAAGAAVRPSSLCAAGPDRRSVQPTVDARPTVVGSPDPAATAVSESPTFLNDSAVLADGNDPTGTLTFTLFGPSLNELHTESVTVDGDGTYSTLAGYQLPAQAAATGIYQWEASYSGNDQNCPASDESSDEQVTVSPASPTLTGTADPGSVTLSSNSSTLEDSTVLSGGYDPTGTITFTLTDPNATVVDTEMVPVSGNGTYATPVGYTLPTGAPTGAYQWEASYSGDADNNAVSDDGVDGLVPVSPASPNLTATAEPGSEALSTDTGTLHDSAVLSGGDDPTGTITFTLTDPNATVVDTETVEVSGNGTYSTPTGFVPQAAGTYQWDASYSGDGANASATDDGPDGQVTVSPASPTLTSTPDPTSTALASPPGALRDSTVLSGGSSPTGTITFTLYGPAGSVVDTETVAVDGNGTYATPTGYTPAVSRPATGTYQWDVSYSGDADNNAASDDDDVAEQVAVTPGLLRSTTSLTVGTSSLTYGDETVETFSGEVAGRGGAGHPEGTVTVSWGAGTTLCSAALTPSSAGTATYSCSVVSATQLNARAYTAVVAVYQPATSSSSNANYSYRGSRSAVATLSVAPDGTVTTVSASLSSVALHHEANVLFTTTVTTDHGESVPNSQWVTIDIGTAHCVAKLTGGTGSCRIANDALPTGVYPVEALYAPNDANLGDSGGHATEQLVIRK